MPIFRAQAANRAFDPRFICLCTSGNRRHANAKDPFSPTSVVAQKQSLVQLPATGEYITGPRPYRDEAREIIGLTCDMPTDRWNNRFADCAENGVTRSEKRACHQPPCYYARASPRIVDQDHDQTEAPSTSRAVTAAVHIGTCRFISRNTPTGMENVATTVIASDSFLRTKNISDPHALIPGKRASADPLHLATGNKQEVPPLRQPSDAFRPLSRKKLERCCNPSGFALLSSQRCTPKPPFCQLWQIRNFPRVKMRSCGRRTRPGRPR